MHVTKHKTENNLGNIVVQYRLQPSLVRLWTNPQPDWAELVRGSYYKTPIMCNEEHARGKQEKIATTLPNIMQFPCFNSILF